MRFVSALLKQAAGIFETACEAGGENCDWAILINAEGGIYMMPAAGWATEPLRLHAGAPTAYRVSRRNGEVTVEGRSPDESCNLRRDSPQRRLGIGFDRPQYVTT
jgi:hypothetical protein